MWLSRAISESTWGYPIVGALHILAIALFGGSVLVTDLRVLGLALRDVSASEVAAELRPWKWIGLATVMLTGMLLFAARAVRYSHSTFFQLKMLLLILLAVNGLCFPGAKRISAGFSLVLWAAVIFAARGIAFL